MKKTFIVVLAVILVVVMASSCSTNTQEPTAEAPAAATEDTGADAPATEEPAAESPQAASDGEKVKLAGVVFLEDQFMKMMTAGYQAAANDDGNIELLTANSNQDASREAELIDTYTQQGVQGIAIAPVEATTSIAPLKRASEAGIPIVLTNQFLTASDDDASFVIAAFSSTQSNLGEITGKACGEYIKENMGGKAKIGIIQFMALSTLSAERSDGFKEAVLEVCPDVEFVADADAWEQDTGIQVAGDMLTANPDIDILWAANEGGTIGATMAVKNANKAGEVFVFGTDASDQIINFLNDPDNILQAVTGQNPYQMGYDAIKTLATYVRGGDISDVAGDNPIPGVLLSRDDPASISSFEEIIAQAS